MEPVATAAELGVRFDRYEVEDALGRTVTFYLSLPTGGAPRPLALWIGGSGGQSAFERRGDRVSAGFADGLRDVVEDRAWVLVVEKPGVGFGDGLAHPGTAIGASEAFVREHTLPRWVEANRAALDAALTRTDVDRSKVLAVGHSEGGQVVCALAAVEPRITHVASLAGGGPSQLFDLVLLGGVDDVYPAWAAIAADPEATTLWWGHPYRRWSSFLSQSPLDGLRASGARVYLAWGTKDRATPAVSGEVMAAELTRLGRDVTVERRQGEDHGFRGRGHGAGVGFRDVFTHVVTWWLGR